MTGFANGPDENGNDAMTQGRKDAETFLRWKVEHESQIRNFRLMFYTLTRSPLSVIGFSLVALFLIIALIGPSIITHPADIRGAIHMDQKLRPPSPAHFFGTDEVGRDIYSRVVMGTRLSFQIGLIIVFVALGIGVPMGIIAGYAGGWVNEVIMRITDIFLSVPGLLLALAIVGALGPGYQECHGRPLAGLVAGLCQAGSGKDAFRERGIFRRSRKIDRSFQAKGDLQPYPSELHLSHHCQGIDGYGNGDPFCCESWFHRRRSAAAGARMGSDDLSRPELPDGSLVDGHFPGIGHPHHGPGV